MGNHSAVRRRPPDLRQVLVGVLAVLLVVATAVVLGLLLSERDVPPPKVHGPAPSASTTAAAVPFAVEDDERAALLGVAASATEEIVDQVADATELMTPRYARVYRRTVDDDPDPVAAATVVGTGLVGIDRDAADVLVLVDRAEAEPTSVVLHLRRYRAQWRVDDLVPVTEPVAGVTEPDQGRRDVLAAAEEAARTHGAEPAEVLAAGLAAYGPTSATVLVAAEGDVRLRVAMTLVDGTWAAKVSELEPVSAD